MTIKPQVNFYILSDANDQRRDLVFHQLVEKATKHANKVLILCESQPQQDHFDQLLWSAKKTSFIPHAIFSAENDLIEQVIIATKSDQEQLDSSLFSVAFDFTTSSIYHYPKVIIISNQHKELLKNARQKFQAYKTLGIEPKTYKLDESKKN